jgi:hypothetical protein
MQAACLTLLFQVSRMAMNIRGLIMDDPDHTVHLQTLRFASGASTSHSHHGVQIASNPAIGSAIHELA